MITDSDVMKAIRQIERMVSDGWSMPYSRKVACGADSTELSQRVRLHDSYLAILNHYMRKMHNYSEYKRDEKQKLRAIKRMKNAK